MVVQFAKSFKDYVMAVVKYNNKIFAIPWEEIMKKCKINQCDLKNITYCIHREYITFVFICENDSFVMVYNADTGVFDYINNGKHIIKATYCGGDVCAIAKIPDCNGIALVYKYESSDDSNAWKIYNTGLKKKCADDDYNDYNLIPGTNDAYIKLKNPLNDIEYVNYIKDNYSIYSLYDYWKDKDIDISEGEINENSIFIDFRFGDISEPVSITHCNDVKFAAGYLKYIVLGDVAYSILNSEWERNPVLVKDDKELENDYIPDVEYMLDFFIKNTKDKNTPVSLLEEMVELCDNIFLEKDSSKALDMFRNTCSLCYKYFQEKIFHELGFVYSIRSYNGLTELKEALPSINEKSKYIK